MKKNLSTLLGFSLIMAVWMRGWINLGVPLTPREENISQLTDLANYVKAARKHTLWNAWNFDENTGTPSLIQRSFIVFAPLAQLSYLTNIPADIVYKLSMLVGFALSATGMYLLLTTIKLHPLAAVIGAISYMLSPPHITLASDLLDFNFYWALLPLVILCAEKFIAGGSPLRYGSLTGLALTLASFSGNTYFVTSMPFFLVYILLRIIISRQTEKFLFLAYTIGFFLTLSAFITLPSTIELPYTWLSQEIQRRQIIDLPQVSQLLRLFILRLQNHSPLSWSMDFRYPDLSWYFGSIVVLLSALSLTKFKKNSPYILPIVIILVSILPLFLAMQQPIVKRLALTILEFSPQIQSVFDRTYRLFILPSFFLSLMAGLGSHILLKSRWAIIAPLIILAILIDFVPLSAYFYTTSTKQLSLPAKTVTAINQTPGRYWLAFPYVSHLPKYKYEYVSRQINLPRVNSEYSYNALAPLYSAQLLEHDLFGALERKRLTPEQVNHRLILGNANIIILPQASHDYTQDVTWFENHSWETLKRTNSYWVLKRNPSLIMQWVRTSPEIINLALSNPKTKSITISESWYPGWQVSIDGERTSLLRSNTAFLGVTIPAGYHHVEFRYRQPWYYPAGKIISMASLILLCLVLYRHRLQP